MMAMMGEEGMLSLCMDEMYMEPSPEVISMVKMEKVDRSEFRVTLKKKKYDQKEQIECMAFGDGDVAEI